MPRLAILLMSITLIWTVTAIAQGPTYHRGRTMSLEEVKAWDVNAVGPEGKELPPGGGTALQGGKVWTQRCASCHGADAKFQWPLRAHPPSGGKAPILAGEKGVVVSRQFATTLWDYIHRAMPLGEQAGTLAADEVYGVTAYLLYLNGIIKQDQIMDASSLPTVQMPHGPRMK